MSRALGIRTRLTALYLFLAAFTGLAWLSAVLMFHGQPALMGIAVLIYGLGLRHAVDADHIAAIDNVTRKLLRDGQRPIAVGFFFAAGHSTVVTIVAVAVAGAASLLSVFEGFREVGGLISTMASALFLIAVAVMNIVIFRSLWRTYRGVRRGEPYVEEDLDLLLGNRSILSRLLRPLFKLVTRSWHMFPLGFVFGLGFDTATEITMFSLSASQAAHGVPLVTLLIFPALFAAGMTLVDTTDGVVMLGAYEWAFVKPLRKLSYNMIITLVSAAVALFTGGVEALGLIGDRLSLSGPVWRISAAIGDDFNRLGVAIAGVIVLAWALSYLVYLRMRDDEETPAPADGARSREMSQTVS